jgi:hypothetical protein
MIVQNSLPNNLWKSHKYMNFRSQRTFIFEDGELRIAVPARNELTATILLSKRVDDVRAYALVEVR